MTKGKNIVMILILVFLTISTLFQGYSLYECTVPVEGTFVKYTHTGGSKSPNIKSCYNYEYNGVSYQEKSQNTYIFSAKREVEEMQILYVNPNYPFHYKDIEGIVDGKMVWNIIMISLLVFCMVILSRIKPMKHHKKM